MLWVTHSPWSGTNLSPRFHRASSVLPELISFAVLQPLSLLTPENSTIHSQPGFTHRRRECTQDGWEGTASPPQFPGPVWGERVPSSLRTEPGPRAVGAELRAPAGKDEARGPGCRGRARGERRPLGGNSRPPERRESRERKRRQEERERGEDAGTRYGAECLPVPP